MWLVMVAKSNAVRVILHRDLECQVHESRQIEGGLTRDGKGERRYSSNQRTKIEWNG